MIINYWDCKYEDHDDFFGEEVGETRVYGCSHPFNEYCYCSVANKFYDAKAECPMAELKVGHP